MGIGQLGVQDEAEVGAVLTLLVPNLDVPKTNQKGKVPVRTTRRDNQIFSTLSCTDLQITV